MRLPSLPPSPDFSLLPKRAYVAFSVVLGALFLLTLHNRIARFDDAWCTEQSYWVLKTGIARSELFAGYNFWDERMFVFHKAFVYAQVPVLAVLGPTIWAARVVPMVFTGVGLWLVRRYFRGAAEAQWLVTVLYLGCGCLWLYGVDNRPETMTVACGFGSFLLLRPPVLSGRRIAAAAGVAGLSALTHLNGVVFVAAGTLWLAGRRAWGQAVLFGAVGTLTAGLYLLDALLAGQLERLLYQFTQDHAAQGNFRWQAKLAVLARYPNLYFHSDGELPLTVLFLLTGLVVAARRATRPLVATPGVAYAALLFGLFWVLTKNTPPYYFLLLAPFLMTGAVEVGLRALPHLSAAQRRALLVLVCLYPIGGVARTHRLLRDNASEGYVMTENARLASYMPERGARVIAPIDFFFGQMPHYRVHSLTYFALTNPAQPLPEFFADAARDSVRYIICDYREWNQVYHIPRDAPARIGPYRRVFQGPWRGVYALVRPGTER